MIRPSVLEVVVIEEKGLDMSLDFELSPSLGRLVELTSMALQR